MSPLPLPLPSKQSVPPPPATPLQQNLRKAVEDGVIDGMFQVEEANIGLVTFVEPLKALHEDDPVEAEEEEEAEEDGVEDADDGGGDAHHCVLEDQHVTQQVEDTPER